jgi:hypothetical protein
MAHRKSHKVSKRSKRRSPRKSRKGSKRRSYRKSSRKGSRRKSFKVSKYYQSKLNAIAKSRKSKTKKISEMSKLFDRMEDKHYKR